MITDRIAPAEDLTARIDAMLDAPEPESLHHDSPECAALLLAGGLLLLSPSAPRPKKTSH
ncbi:MULTISPECIES: hypothetical protein [unclassified Streptomyces]|uniref:hypothetical protein n=1 Tax=unclassified Streptomyces TaxID=2593676 RepID=UPI000DB92CC8|nr:MULTISPECIES: hypothetical protein [unclassified Streptomyces]MYT69768.1 hypothetical protein [Streptomyces sp. SID8367]RAJ70400.1 hypothetical protein K377_07975 [Streptomyces sp. PsTaAH-137]